MAPDQDKGGVVHHKVAVLVEHRMLDFVEDNPVLGQVEGILVAVVLLAVG